MTFSERFSFLLSEYVKEKDGKSARQFVNKFNNTDPKDITLTSSAVTEYQKDGRTPRPDIIVKIATFFGVSTDFLLGVSDIRVKDESIQAAAKTLGISAEILERYCNTGAPAGNEHRSVLEFLLLDYSNVYAEQKQLSRVFDYSLLSRLHNALLSPQNSNDTFFLVEANNLFNKQHPDFLSQSERTPVISAEDYQEFSRLRLNNRVKECEKDYTDYLAQHKYRTLQVCYPKTMESTEEGE